jgi:hypothetical protein
MKKSDFRTPLLQSGILLFVFLLLFSFVISSGADGLGSGLLAIFSGIFHSILFAIGLIFSILVSITLLIVLFLAAVALYSLDKAKDLWSQLQFTLLNFFSAMNDSLAFMKNRSLETFCSQTSRIPQLEKEVASLSEQNRNLQLTINSLNTQIDELQSMQSKDREEGQDPNSK